MSDSDDGDPDDGDDAPDAGEPDAAPDAAPPTFAVTGTVTGLGGSGLVLRLNGSTDITINDDGSFSFPSNLDDGDSYEVVVASDPTCPHRLCTVADGSGTISGDDAVISVTCIAPLYRLVSHNWGAPQSMRITDDVVALADGATATPRIVTGASTGLGSTETDSAAFDPTKNLLYAPAQNTVPDPSILVFEDASTVTGDVAPTRQIVIEGAGQFAGIELDEAADRLYVTGNAAVYVLDDASTLTGTVEPTAEIALTAPGPISLDREADRLYIASEGESLYILDGARELTSASTVSRTATWTNPVQTAFSLAIDGCRNRLYLSMRNEDTNVNVFVLNNASTLTGALDLHAVSQARLGVPNDQVMSTALDGDGRLYFWTDSATAVQIVNSPHTLAGFVEVDPDKTINAVVASGYGLDLMPYPPPAP